MDNRNWYELWMNQSKAFFESADKNLKDVFGQGAGANPEEHLKQIQQWLETLKNQWQVTQLTEQQKHYAEYWKTMSKMCSDANDMLLNQWIKRTREKHPIQNTHELYELWLNCCSEVYQKAMHSKSYQDAYGEFMNAALQFWKNAIPK